jgi:hypothetical protein
MQHRRCPIRGRACAVAAVLVVAACGHHSDTSPSTSDSSTTTVDAQAAYTQRAAQGAQWCNQAFAAPPTPAQTPGRGPLTSFEKDDPSGLNGGQLSDGSPVTDWTEEPGLLVLAGGAPAPDDTATVNTILCVQGSYHIVGNYVDENGATSPAARIDYDARLVDWHTGAVLAAGHFEGFDPQQHTVTSNPGAVQAGDAPIQALGDWVKGLVSV